MTNLQKKSYFILFVIILLNGSFFYLTYLGYIGEKKLSVFLHSNKVDKEFKHATQHIFDLISFSQNHFNRFILFRELSDLRSYNQSLFEISLRLDELVRSKKQSITLRKKLNNNVLLSDDLILLKSKIDSLIKDKTIIYNPNLDDILKIPNYQFDEVLKSVEFETKRKVDSVKKKSFFSRLGSAMKGDVDVQKEKINSILKLKFGNKLVFGDIKQQFKNVLLESQKHYMKQFGILESGLTKIKENERKLILMNSSLIKLFNHINKELVSTIEIVLDNNTERINNQTKLNSNLRFYLIITVLVLIIVLLALLLKYINMTFRMKKRLFDTKEQIAKDLYLKNKLISILTHEIKTPVSIIGLYGAFIKTNECNEEEFQLFLDTITYTANTLKYISNQAVELVKRDDDEIKLNLEKIDLSKESLQIINSLKVFSDSKNIKLNFNNELPKTLEIQFDKAKFYQLIYNIVGNAIKFAKSNINITAKIKQENGNEQFFFIVEDDGAGISKEDQNHIFDLEYQSKNNKSIDMMSFGLGLYLCKNIISVCGGEILVESEFKKGTIISFNFKLQK